MFAVIAKFDSGRIHLIGFANSEAEVNRLTKAFINANGREKLESLGCRFLIELAA